MGKLEKLVEQFLNKPPEVRFEDDTYSGKLLLRMPKSLHRRLAEEADRENVSLNQYIVSLLSRG